MKIGKFKKIAATTAISLACAFAGAESANAISVGDTLSFSTDDPTNQASLVENPDGTFTFDVGTLINAIGSTGDFAATIGNGFQTNSILLEEVAPNNNAVAATYSLLGSDIAWFSGLPDGNGGLSRTYSLNSFVLNRTGDLVPGFFGFNATFSGLFRPPTVGARGQGGLGGFGTLASANGATVAGSAAVVPTPAAVLPALFGMGTAAFRKKKREGKDGLALAGTEKS